MSQETTDGRGTIRIDIFTTLDGVAQAPGGPDEDTSNGFRFGGWQAALPDETVGREVVGALSDIDALLLGRRTYDVFAAYWPEHTTGPAGVIGQIFNRVPKYVATRGDQPLPWQGSVRVGEDLPAEIEDIRRRHRTVAVIGSLDLAQTLLAGRLFDELRLWVYPIVLGSGKRLFPEGAKPAGMRLLGEPVTAGNGAVLLRYAPGAETPATATVPD